MIWFIFALLSAFLSGTYYMLSKKGVKNSDPTAFLTATFIVAGVFLLIASLIKGIPSLGSKFYFALVVSVILNVFAGSLYMRALKITDLSLAMPMLSFTPVFLILTSFLILGEFPSTFGIIGIFVIVFGSYILNSKKNDRSVFDPLIYIFKHKGSLYMLGVAVLYSIMANYGKVLLSNSDYLFGSSMMLLVSGGIFLVLSFFDKEKRITTLKKDSFWSVVLSAVVNSSSLAFLNLALLTQIVPYAISIRRLSIIFSVLYGDFLFKEKNITRRIIGALIMVAGAVLIVIF